MNNSQLEIFFGAKGEYLRSPQVKTIYSRFTGAIPANTPEKIIKTENKAFSLDDSVKCDFSKGGSLTGTTIKWNDGTYDDVRKQLIRQGEEQYADVKFLPQKMNVKKPSQEELLTDLLLQKRFEKELDIRTGLELFGLSPTEIEDALSKKRVEDALKSIEKPSALRREDALRTAIRESRRAEPEMEVEMEEEQTEPAVLRSRAGRPKVDFPSAKTLINNPARLFELVREYGIAEMTRAGKRKSNIELAGEVVNKYPESVRKTR